MSGEDAVRKFQREMRKLGLGVSIKCGDDEWVEVVPPPEPDATTGSAHRPSHQDPDPAGTQE